jgi:hypothetical protein
MFHVQSVFYGRRSNCTTTPKKGGKHICQQPAGWLPSHKDASNQMHVARTNCAAQAANVGTASNLEQMIILRILS